MKMNRCALKYNKRKKHEKLYTKNIFVSNSTIIDDQFGNLIGHQITRTYYDIADRKTAMHVGKVYKIIKSEEKGNGKLLLTLELQFECFSSEDSNTFMFDDGAETTTG